MCEKKNCFNIQYHIGKKYKFILSIITSSLSYFNFTYSPLDIKICCYCFLYSFLVCILFCFSIYFVSLFVCFFWKRKKKDRKLKNCWKWMRKYLSFESHFFYYLKKKKSFFAKCIFLLEQIKYKNRARWLAKYFKALSLRSKVPVQSLVRPSVVKIAANYIGSFV